MLKKKKRLLMQEVHLILNLYDWGETFQIMFMPQGKAG
jgi:hypothetical protein